MRMLRMTCVAMLNKGHLVRRVCPVLPVARIALRRDSVRTTLVQGSRLGMRHPGNARIQCCWYGNIE